jgi:hypothetical protein
MVASVSQKGRGAQMPALKMFGENRRRHAVPILSFTSVWILLTTFCVSTVLTQGQNIIDINSASLEQLATLPGIGSGDARTIIGNRFYNNTKDLVDRSVIQKEIYKNIESRIVAAAPKTNFGLNGEPPCQAWKSKQALRTTDVPSLKKNVAKLNCQATVLLGDYYFEGKGGLPQDYSIAASLYHRVPNGPQFSESKARLGLMYQLGNGVPEDDTRGFEFYKIAAEENNPRGLRGLAQS